MSMRRMWRDRGAAIGLIVTLLFPVLLGFGLLIVDGARLYHHILMVRQAAQAAALAGGNKLTSYYTSGNGSTSQIVAAAQQFALLNAPAGKYGTLVAASDITVGNWDLASAAFTSLAQSGGSTPNAVQVTGRSTSANGNALTTLFGGMFGKGATDVSSTAITSYATGKSFHVILVNDMTNSFSNALTQQKAADQAILDCVKNSSGPTSQFGLVMTNGRYTVYQTPIVVSTNYNALKTKITNITSSSCGTNCGTGSNVAAGLYEANVLFGNTQYNDTFKNVVIITDGVPSASNFTYTRAEGIYPTPASNTAVCTSNCSDANLLTMAQNQAAYARSQKISISTIYYSGNTAANQQASYAASLATLVGGTGIALVAPTTTKITQAFGAFCATMSSKLMSIR